MDLLAAVILVVITGGMLIAIHINRTKTDGPPVGKDTDLDSGKVPPAE